MNYNKIYNKFMHKASHLTCLCAMSVSVCFTSCSNDLESDFSAKGKGGILFNLNFNNYTRGIPVTSANYAQRITDFQVWAYFAKGATGTGVTQGGRYVGVSDTEGTKVNGNGSGVWNYADPKMQQYWPATTAPLNFQAIAPHSHGSFTIENTPDVGDPYLAHLSANVTVPTAVKNQQDIMFAKADNQTRETNSQTVSLEFSHAMSQVVFSGKLASDKIEATVHGIELHNIHQTGTVGYTGANAELKASVTGDASTIFAAGLVPDVKVTSSTQSTVLSATDGALFMLPQTVEKWTTSAKNPVPLSEADAKHQSYMKISCSIKDVTNNTHLLKNENIYIPLEVNWEQGKKYYYTLLFGNGSSGFDATGKPSDKVVPITFTVKSSDNWVNGTGGDLELGENYQPAISFKDAVAANIHLESTGTKILSTNPNFDISKVSEILYNKKVHAPEYETNEYFGFIGLFKFNLIDKTYIPAYMFNRIRLSNVFIPHCVETIEERVFESSSMTDVSLSSNLKIIGGRAFANSDIEDIIFYDKLTHIGSEAFERCLNLALITSHASVAPKLGSNVFKDIPNVGTLKIPQGSTGYEAWLQQLGPGWQIEYLP